MIAAAINLQIGCPSQTLQKISKSFLQTSPLQRQKCTAALCRLDMLWIPYQSSFHKDLYAWARPQEVDISMQEANAILCFCAKSHCTWCEL